MVPERSNTFLEVGEDLEVDVETRPLSRRDERGDKTPYHSVRTDLGQLRFLNIFKEHSVLTKLFIKMVFLCTFPYK